MTLSSAMRMTTQEAARLKPMRIPGPVKPKTFSFGAPAKKAPAKQTTAINPYDAFNVGNPYDPATIHQTAQSSWQADVDQATGLSKMGYLTPEQIDAQSANRAAQQQALGASLAAAMSGIQRVNVGSGNAGAAGLAAQDAQTTATGDRAQSIAGSAPAPTAPAEAGTRAVIAAQTASEGNMYGALQAAGLSAADQAAKAAYAAGDTLKQTQAADQAKSLAAILSGVAPVSARESSMVDANTKATAADKATQLTIWQNLQNQELQAKASGDKRAIAAAQLESKNYLAGISDKTKRDLGIASNKTKLATAKTAAAAKITTANTAADAKLAAAKIAASSKKQAALIAAAAKKATASGTKPPTVSQRLSVNKQITKIMGTQGGTKTPAGQVTTAVTVTLMPKPGTNAELDNPKGLTVTVSPDQVSGIGKKYGDYTVTGTAPKKKTGAAGVKDSPSTWTKWKRAHGLVMQTFGMDRTAATQYMAAAGYPAPSSS